MSQLGAVRLPTVPVSGRARERVVVLRAMPWAQYDALCRARADCAGARMAYLDGTLEIMSPGRPHEHDKTLIARLVEAFAEERGLSLNGFGSQTFKRKAKKAGVEPDECYCVGTARPIPDIAIEVVYSGGIDKLEIYRRLKVPEVWYWAKGRSWLYRLEGRRYRTIPESDAIPAIDLVVIAKIVVSTDESHQTEAVRAYRVRRGARVRPLDLQLEPAARTLRARPMAPRAAHGPAPAVIVVLEPDTAKFFPDSNAVNVV